MKREKIIFNIFAYVFLVTILIITVIPIIYTISASFKSNAEILANPAGFFPQEPTLDNYVQAMSRSDFNLPKMFWNSTYYTLFCVAFTLMTSSMAGYVFARSAFPGKKVIFAVFSSLMFISMGSITIYPTFEVLHIIRLDSSLWGLIVMKLFGVGIVNIYLVRSYIRSIPVSLDEAAEIDGCGFFTTFIRVILPLIKPIMATIGILAFQGSWNEYLLPTIFTMSNPEQRTLIVGITALKNSGESASSWNLMLAGTTVSLIPVLIAYAVANKYFVAGITTGAVKG